MVNKRFLSYRVRRYPDIDQVPVRIYNAVFYTGVSILIFALIYMLLNLDKADSIVMIWLPFMIAGSVLVFMSLIMKSAYNKKNAGKRR